MGLLSVARPGTRQARRKLGGSDGVGKPAPLFRGLASSAFQVGRRPKIGDLGCRFAFSWLTIM